MPKFSKRSSDKLSTCHPDLIRLFTEVVGYYDCTILDGFRDEQKQNHYFQTGKSQLQWPDSKHNIFPSRGIDSCWYPINEAGWEDREKFKFFRGFVYGIAAHLEVSLNKTIEWDLSHFELRGNG